MESVSGVCVESVSGVWNVVYGECEWCVYGEMCAEGLNSYSPNYSQLLANPYRVLLAKAIASSSSSNLSIGGRD